MLARIRIVLVNPSHPGNIGAAARAMKTMGLSKLYLVAPEKFPHPKALEMAVSAADVLTAARVVTTVAEAVADCQLVIGTSARDRTIPWPLLTPKTMAETLQAETSSSEIAILFGREQSGLTNEELHLCHWHMQIPANPEYSSLNLAAAVQIIAYELRQACLNESPEVIWDYRWVTAQEMEKLYAHLEKVLMRIDFLKASAPRQLMTRLRRFFSRARLDVMEMNIWRGMLNAIEEKLPEEVDNG